MDALNDRTTERPNDGNTGGAGALLLAYAHAAGVVALADGERLVVRGPGSAREVVAALGLRKGEVLAALTTSVVSSFGRSVVGVLAEDGPTSCADCSRGCYGVAGFPPLCLSCVRERAGVPALRWDIHHRSNDRTTKRPCYACGSRWQWQRPTGGWVCSTCHPQPTEATR